LRQNPACDDVQQGQRLFRTRVVLVRLLVVDQSNVRRASTSAALWLAAALSSVACQCGKPAEPPAPPVAQIPKTYVPKAKCSVTRPMVASTGAAPATAEPGDEADDDDVELALVTAAFDRAYEAKQYDEALACAQEVSRLIPDEPLGHIQRALALDGLEVYIEAHQAYERAIAVDPFNPDALLPAANYLVAKADTDSLETAAIYARRGRENEKSVERAAELAAIEAEALNGLGRCDEALRAAESALALDSDSARGHVERGVALFELLRFDEAEKALGEARAKNASDAKAQHYSGLVVERAGRLPEAEKFFAEATRLDPALYPAALDVSPEEFQKMVDAEVKRLSKEERAALEATKFSWSDLPAMDDLLAGDPVLSPTIVGIFRPGEPDAILLYRKNLLRVAHTRDELRAEVRDTLLHEIGHLNGEDDDELRDRGL
jgi:tetratricopeptide (TPR) repeat protein